VKIYRAAITLYKKLGRWPTDLEIKDACGIRDLSGGIYMVRFIQSLLGYQKKLNRYDSKHEYGDSLRK